MSTTYTVDFVRRVRDEDGDTERLVERKSFSSKEDVEAFAEEYFTPGIFNAYGVGYVFGRPAGLRVFIGDEPAFDIMDPYADQM